MKKFLLAAALTIVGLGASAHPANRVHYHNDDGTITVSRSFEPVTETSYERDAAGRSLRVETTTTCTDVRINPRNNHLRCRHEQVEKRYFYDNRYNPPVQRPEVEPVVYRHVERDNRGRRIIVTTTYTCTDARWSPDRSQVLCFNWESEVTREVVRRRPRDNYNYDLNGDGRVDGWESLLYQGFRDLLDDDN